MMAATFWRLITIVTLVSAGLLASRDSSAEQLPFDFVVGPPFSGADLSSDTYQSVSPFFGALHMNQRTAVESSGVLSMAQNASSVSPLGWARNAAYASLSSNFVVPRTGTYEVELELDAAGVSVIHGGSVLGGCFDSRALAQLDVRVSSASRELLWNADLAGLDGKGLAYECDVIEEGISTAFCKILELPHIDFGWCEPLLEIVGVITNAASLPQWQYVNLDGEKIRLSDRDGRPLRIELEAGQSAVATVALTGIVSTGVAAVFGASCSAVMFEAGEWELCNQIFELPRPTRVRALRFVQVQEAPSRPREEGGLDGFRTFARLVETALSERDVAFFVDRAIVDEAICPELGDLPGCSRSGEVLRGLWYGIWATDALGLVSADIYRGLLTDFFGALRPSATDELGDGRAQLYAIGKRRLCANTTHDDETFVAAVTGITDRTYYQPGIKRDAYALAFVYRDGQWRTCQTVFTRGALATAVLGVTDRNEWEYWERWPASGSLPNPTPMPDRSPEPTVGQPSATRVVASILPPHLVSPSPDALVAVLAPSGCIDWTFEWLPSAGGVSYEVAIGPDLGEPLLTRTVERTQLALTDRISDLVNRVGFSGPATWLWHVRAHAADGSSSEWSEARALRVNQLVH